MKRSKHPKGVAAPLTSLKELRAEKLRLQREILGTEEEIKENYHSLVDALTFRNILNTVAEEIVATNVLVSQAYSIIRPLFKRKKKKKRVEKPEKKEETNVE
ncbi:MAG: hypothetical protein JXA23_02585 [Bacteroidales bacterium]|nr:hypothetical protein [Bacteroidales bacterium]